MEHRVYTCVPIFPSCEDCLSYLPSAQTVHDLLLPAMTTICKSITSYRDCPHDFASCWDSQQEAKSCQRLGRKLFIMHKSLWQKQEIRDDRHNSRLQFNTNYMNRTLIILSVILPLSEEQLIITTTAKDLTIFAVIRALPFLNNSKDLDPSYKIRWI